MNDASAARRDHRHPRRRPARPHDGARRAPHGLPHRRARSDRALPHRRRSPTASSSARSTTPRPRCELADAGRRRSRSTPSTCPPTSLDQLATHRAGAARRRRCCARIQDRAGPEAVPRPPRLAAGARGRRSATPRELAAALDDGRRARDPQGRGAPATTARARSGIEPARRPGRRAARRSRGEPAVLEELRAVRARDLGDPRARHRTASSRVYPLAENVHRRHILHTTRAPAPAAMPRADARRRDRASPIAEALDHVGVMAVEMFELADGRAARQRDRAAHAQQRPLHATARAPRRSSSSTCARCAACRSAIRAPLTGAVMVNLIGDLWARGPAGVAARAGAPRGAPAPLRQGRAGARPQDGPRLCSTTTPIAPCYRRGADRDSNARVSVIAC